MEQQYLTTLLEAYTRGYEKRYNSKEDVPERKEHYFKVKDDRRNFYNKMLKLGILSEAEPRPANATNRTPNKYRFNADKYSELKQKGFRLEF